MSSVRHYETDNGRNAVANIQDIFETAKLFVKKSKKTVSQALRWQGNTRFAQLSIKNDEWLEVIGYGL